VRTGLTRQGVGRILSRLHAAGDVRRLGHGRYCCPD
jgi:hypothetical protein